MALCQLATASREPWLCGQGQGGFSAPMEWDVTGGLRGEDSVVQRRIAPFLALSRGRRSLLKQGTAAAPRHIVDMERDAKSGSARHYRRITSASPARGWPAWHTAHRPLSCTSFVCARPPARQPMLCAACRYRLQISSRRPSGTASVRWMATPCYRTYSHHSAGGRRGQAGCQNARASRDVALSNGLDASVARQNSAKRVQFETCPEGRGRGHREARK